MKMSKEAMGSGGPPEKLLKLLNIEYPLEMTCRIKNYAAGIDAVFGRGGPDPKVIESLCEGSLATLMQLKPSGEHGRGEPLYKERRDYGRQPGEYSDDYYGRGPESREQRYHSYCGDGVCDMYKGEDEFNCKVDCGKGSEPEQMKSVESEPETTTELIEVADKK